MYCLEQGTIWSHGVVSGKMDGFGQCRFSMITDPFPSQVVRFTSNFMESLRLVKNSDLTSFGPFVYEDNP